MIYPIYTETTECRDCYKCVRNCPVKAIQVKDASAVVVKDRCIYCGRCVDTCPAHAKKVRSDVARVQQFMKSKKRVIASVAPSFAAEFSGVEDEFLCSLIKLGFSGVSETSIGAALVNATIEAYARAHGGSCPWISTACSSVVALVKKYYPELKDKLAPVPSPLQCHSAYLRHLYGDDIGIVFIGPCIAKKVEADEYPGYPDFSLTFDEYRDWLAAEKIALSGLNGKDAPSFIPCRAGSSSFYPVEGGMIASLAWGKDPFQTNAVAISGTDSIIGTLKSLKGHSPEEYQTFLELLCCEGGCINGPGTAKGRSSADRKGDASKFTSERVREQGTFVPPVDFVARLSAEGYGVLKPIREKEDMSVCKPFASHHTEEEIQKALRVLGKNSKSDELNCGGCGYNSCREMAIAYLDGMAEPEMCVTKMRKEAQSKVDVLLRTIPMGVVMVDDQLRIHDCNAGFLMLFGDIGFEVDGQALNLVKGLPLDRFVPFYEKFQDQFTAKGKTNQYRLHYKDKFLRVTFFNVDSQHLVGALFEDVTSPTVRRETVVKKAEDVIQKSLSTVQQIASLLGENAADTEIMLNSLIDAFKVPPTEKDDENGFSKDDQQDLT
ncbi:MAG: [Fe-Fe] hydrogenase large subunit C-terminal domain-containing protein [Sphaerochaetaceae bacterium]